MAVHGRMLLVVGAIAVATTGPAAARASQVDVAHAVALRWSASVPATARLGAEPPSRCRRLDARHGACPIAIVVLARGARGERPWRCAATVLVSRTHDQKLAAQRSNTHCTRFPRPSATPDPAAALGTAVALNAKGDVACLPASDGRMTCVMRYAAPTSERRTAAASIPLGRPARSIALGAPLGA
jgi:hypothetical protein